MVFAKKYNQFAGTTIAQKIQRTEYVIIKMQTLGNCSGPTSWFLQQVNCEEKKTGLEGEREKENVHIKRLKSLATNYIF